MHRIRYHEVARSNARENLFDFPLPVLTRLLPVLTSRACASSLSQPREHILPSCRFPPARPGAASTAWGIYWSAMSVAATNGTTAARGGSRWFFIKAGILFEIPRFLSWKLAKLPRYIIELEPFGLQVESSRFFKLKIEFPSGKLGNFFFIK